MEVNGLGWKLLNGQLEIGFLCLRACLGVYCTVQITEFWSKVFSLSLKNKIKVLEKKKLFQTGFNCIWEQAKDKNFLSAVGARRERKEWSIEHGNERRIIVDLSVKVFFFKQELSFSCLSFPTGCSLQYFHFPWQNFHWSFLQLDIPHFCLLPGDKYWISYSPGDCCLGYEGKGTLSELIFCSEFSEIILCLTCLWFLLCLSRIISCFCMTAVN